MCIFGFKTVIRRAIMSVLGLAMLSKPCHAAHKLFCTTLVYWGHCALFGPSHLRVGWGDLRTKPYDVWRYYRAASQIIAHFHTGASSVMKHPCHVPVKTQAHIVNLFFVLSTSKWEHCELQYFWNILMNATLQMFLKGSHDWEARLWKTHCTDHLFMPAMVPSHQI